MDKKSKSKSGLQECNTLVQKHSSEFSDSEKHQIIQEYLRSSQTKRDIWEKYTGQTEEHGILLKWMRKLGYIESNSSRKSNFTSGQSRIMPKGKANTEQSSESFEMLQLKKRIAELESQLKDAELKAIAFSTMVDIAEKEFNIPIRKKHNTKPSRK